MKWSAHIDYDQGRCGSSGIYGLHSREAAIEWLQQAFVWSLCWYLLPSCRIEEHPE